jgi:hypothetical protein
MASGQSHSTQTALDSEFYTWSLPGSLIRIHLYLDVVERLENEVLRGFESVLERGVEVGGVLLGRADPDVSHVIEITDFEPIFGEHRSDHRFVLSESDRYKFENLTADRRPTDGNVRSVVGYYRSHNRDGLSLGEEDLSLIRTCFQDPANVFLVIKPVEDRSVNAGFFFWDNDRITSESSFREFPFAAKQLSRLRTNHESSSVEKPATGKKSEIKRSVMQAESVEEMTQPVAEVTAPVNEAKRRGLFPGAPIRWGQATLWLGVAAMVVWGGALGLIEYHRVRTNAKESAGTSDLATLALQVERHGSDLRVSWNRRGSVVAKATGGTLSIRDGETPMQEFRLNPSRLNTGSFLYTPASVSVEFRLDVTDTDHHTVRESVLAVMAQLPNAPLRFDGSPATKPALTNRLLVTPPAMTSPKPPAAVKGSSVVHDDSPVGGPTRVVMIDSLVPNDPGPTWPVPSLQLRASHGTAPPPVSADVSLVPSGKESAAMAGYVEAQPIRQVQPVVPQRIRTGLTGEDEVDVAVRIDEVGRVIRLLSVQHTGPQGGFLTGSAVNAAQRWIFEPARLGEQKVPSDMTLRFRFRATTRNNSGK